MKRDLIGACICSLVGLSYHQFQEFPGQMFYSLVVIVPFALILAGLVWLTQTYRLGYWLLLLYAFIHLIGGGLSVLPLEILPFVPDQTTAHYISHLIYAILQLPLIYITIREVVTDYFIRQPLEASME